MEIRAERTWDRSAQLLNPWGPDATQATPGEPQTTGSHRCSQHTVLPLTGMTSGPPAHTDVACTRTQVPMLHYTACVLGWGQEATAGRGRGNPDTLAVVAAGVMWGAATRGEPWGFNLNPRGPHAVCGLPVGQSWLKGIMFFLSVRDAVSAYEGLNDVRPSYEWYLCSCMTKEIWDHRKHF